MCVYFLHRLSKQGKEMTAHYMTNIGEQEQEPIKPEFSESHIGQFIEDFAACGTQPAKWLAANGVQGAWEDFPVDVPEYLQFIASLWHTTGYSPAGPVMFWKMMHRMAIEKFDFETN